MTREEVLNYLVINLDRLEELEELPELKELGDLKECRIQLTDSRNRESVLMTTIDRLNRKVTLLEEFKKDMVESITAPLIQYYEIRDRM